MSHKRYAIYYAPRPSDLARATASWLGWDVETGSVAQPLEGMPRFPPEVTEAPRKYGFHGTLKAPFRLAPGRTLQELGDAVSRLAATLAPLSLPAMDLSRLGGFVALTPRSDAGALNALAARVVQDLDPFRAALTQADIARRRPEGLSVRQRRHLEVWGYPHVLDEFRFHLTLTGDLSPAQAEPVIQALADWLMPRVPVPFPIQDLCLFGEDDEGKFHLLCRHALTG